MLHSHASSMPATYNDMFRHAELPPLMKLGVMEPRVLKHYLLLHDDANDAGVTYVQ